MIKYSPIVSIIIPVFNGEKYLEKAIQSCINQTYKNIEIIVVDDGSNDNTSLISKKFENKIKYFYKDNGGVSSALNLGIEKSIGEYISWLSHDDFYLENKIFDEIKILSENNRNAIVFSNYNIVNKNSKIVRKIDFSKRLDLSYFPQYLLIYTQSLNGCAMLIPKMMFDKYGLFNVNLKYTQDYEKWYELIGEEFIYNNNFVTCYRIHEDQGSQLYSNCPEIDNLWYKLILSLKENNDWDKFLGHYESLYFFKSIFKTNLSMVNTLKFLNENKIDNRVSDDYAIIKKIKCKIFYFGERYKFSNLSYYYKINGLKKLIFKICITLLNILKNN